MKVALKLRTLLHIFCFVLAMYKAAEAVPAAPVVHTLRQADGTTFAARQWGDERRHGWETLDGYTIVFNAASGNWHYATLDAAGRLVPSARVVGQDSPAPDVPQYLRPQRLPRDRTTEPREAPELGEALPLENSKKVVPSTGTASLPVILINFHDTATTYTQPQFDTLLFGIGNNSMSDYYDEVSYLNFALDGAVVGWYTAANNHDYYGANDPSGSDQWPGDLVYEAVQAADPTVDFSDYDNDGDCYVDVVAIVHQGTGEENSGNNTDIWSHRWSLQSAKNAGRSHHGAYTTNDPCPGGGSIKVNDYIIQPEQLNDGGITTVGVFCHEFGHALGLPDLYDTDYSSEGIGDWGLMGGGSWNEVARAGDRPAHLSAWSKYRLDWVTPTQVVGTLPDEPIEPASSQADVYQLLYGSPSSGGEYFLIENRQQSGFDAGLPGAGLLIWHVEENKTNNTEECYPPSNCSTQHYKVTLVQADNQWHLEKNTNDGDAGDPYPGASNNTNFNDSSTPSSKIWDGRSSNAGATNIHQSGSTMYATLFAKAPWVKTYGGPDSDYASSIQQTTDGGYIVAGQTWSFGAGSSDIWVLKLDADSNVLWQKTYGMGITIDEASSIQQTSDGGYIVAGSSGVGWNIWILKITSDGTVQWQKTYGGSDFDKVSSIQQTRDGGYILTGPSESFADSYADIWVLKLDGNGNITWQKTYGGPYDEQASSIQQTTDGGYIVAGTTSNSDHNTDIWVLKLGSDGTVQWQKTYGTADVSEVAYSIQQTRDGGYIMAGWTKFFRISYYDTEFWVLKLAADGTVQWQKTYGGTGSEEAHSIQQTRDGGYIVAGWTDSFGAGSSDIWVLKLAADGTVQWQKTYGGFYDEQASSIQQASDGGYIVAGWTDSFGASYYSDIWVLKLDGNGNIPGCPVQGTSNAAVGDTAVVGSNSSVTPSDTSITPSDTSITPSDTNAQTLEVCLAQQQYTLTVTSAGPGSGVITSNPAGIDCGADCEQDYIDGTVVTLTATPDPDSTFAGWSGDCAGINTQTTVTMDADKTCTATFDLLLPDLESEPEGLYIRGPISLLRGKLVAARLRSTNQGGQAAGGFVIKVFLSADAVLDAGDLLKKSVRVPSLAPGQARTDTILFVSPSSMAGKYLISQIDAADEVIEADEGNNLVVEQIP
jgi:M6 family metalloprotease-like protein/uncharacterized delta-60 repeat protein